MRFGVVLPTYPAGATVEGVVQVARAAERLGFVSAWTTDHVVLPPDQAGPYREIFEPLLTLGYLAAVTERIALGVSVIVVPQRNGVVLAKELATLDHLCLGRLIVGVGAGWNETEFRMLGAGERFHRRGAYLDETLALWRRLWTAPEVDFQGRFYDLPPVAFGPLPHRAGGPPIWVGGASPGARRRAGRVGAAWHPVGITATAVAEQVGLVREVAEATGRAAPEIAPRLPLQFGQGSSGQVVERLTEYVRAGVAEVVCLFGSPDPAFVVAQMEILAAEVVPALASAGAAG